MRPVSALSSRGTASGSTGGRPMQGGARSASFELEITSAMPHSRSVCSESRGVVARFCSWRLACNRRAAKFTAPTACAPENPDSFGIHDCTAPATSAAAWAIPATSSASTKICTVSFGWGLPQKMSTSTRSGRTRAVSRTSRRFVVPISRTLSVLSIRSKKCDSHFEWWALGPDWRCSPSASSSSMTSRWTALGRAFVRSNSAVISASVSPTYDFANEDALRASSNTKPSLVARFFARVDFAVPGGPYSRAPLTVFIFLQVMNGATTCSYSSVSAFELRI
mmetsp:Transcript_22828/g.39091  ORF Transcript_22828/g.39091 Transcript_22828/m.39091 type:complete len:280 (-) Transcript_22828:815-1654(-)